MTDNICQWVVYFFSKKKMQALPRPNIRAEEAGSCYFCSTAVRMVICHSLQLKFYRKEMDCFVVY